MPIGQLIYFPVDGEIEVKYNQKKNAKYSGQPNKPVESMMWKNKFYSSQVIQSDGLNSKLFQISVQFQIIVEYGCKAYPEQVRHQQPGCCREILQKK